MTCFWIILAFYICASVQGQAAEIGVMDDLKDLLQALSTSLNNMIKHIDNLDIDKQIHDIKELLKDSLKKEISNFCNTFTGDQQTTPSTPRDQETTPSTSRDQQTTQSSGTTLPLPPSADCAEVYKHGRRSNGVYELATTDINPALLVYCDMTTDGGGWTVFQRRGQFDGLPEEDFYRTWDEYKKGFGNLRGEFWLGNDKLAHMTRNTTMELRVDLGDWEGQKAYAKYGIFRIENEAHKYGIKALNYSGNAGNSLMLRAENGFYTKDRDNIYACALFHQGAWWYNNCGNANLNGVNMKGSLNESNSIFWYNWKKSMYSLSFSEMKFRPRNFLETSAVATP